MGKPTLELPDLPQDWLDLLPADTPPAMPDGVASSGGGLLSGLPTPAQWSLANSSLNAFVPPDVMKTIDFDGAGTPDTPPWLNNAGAVPPQPDGGGFYTGLTPYQPDLSAGYQNRDMASVGSSATPVTSNASKGDWVQLPRPVDLEAGESGSGYYTYGTDKSEKPGTAANAQWGAPKTMQVIAAVADKLATGDQYTPFVAGNISLQNGADFYPDHKGHRDGLGIDVRPARTDGAQLPVTHKDPGYDRAATQRLVDAFRATGQVSNIYFNDPQIRGVQRKDGHDNHLHVQLKP